MEGNVFIIAMVKSQWSYIWHVHYDFLLEVLTWTQQYPMALVKLMSIDLFGRLYMPPIPVKNWNFISQQHKNNANKLLKDLLSEVRQDSTIASDA